MLSGILQSHHAAGEFVGARIALRASDGTTTEVVDGTTTVDPASPSVDPDVAWNIGSVTKTFVAVVVLQLADEGKIDLDAGIEQYMPDLADADHITPRELLQHTSGLGEYNDKPAVLNDAHRVWTPAELIAVAEDAGRVGEPGGPFHYSNTNYIALGEIIDKVTGNSWDRRGADKDRRAARHDQHECTRRRSACRLQVCRRCVCRLDHQHAIHRPQVRPAGCNRLVTISCCSPRRWLTAR